MLENFDTYRKKVLLIDSTPYLLEYYSYLLRTKFSTDNLLVLPFADEAEAIEYSLTSNKNDILCIVNELRIEDVDNFNFGKHLRAFWPDCLIFMQTLSRIDDVGKYRENCEKHNVTILDKTDSMKNIIIPWIHDQLQKVLVS